MVRQQAEQFFLVCPCAVVFLLPIDVAPYHLPLPMAYGKGGVAFLPVEIPQPDLVAQPDGGCLFQLSHDI